MAGSGLPDQYEAGAGLLEGLSLAVQLHRVLAAVRSPVVPKPDEDRRGLLPVVPQAVLNTVLVRELDRADLIRPLRRMCVLALARRPDDPHRPAAYGAFQAGVLPSYGCETLSALGQSHRKGRDGAQAGRTRQARRWSRRPDAVRVSVPAVVQRGRRERD